MKRPYNISDFKPLIITVMAIIALTFVGSRLFDINVMQGFMGWFFIVFGLLKSLKIKEFAMAFAKYDLIAKQSTTYAKTYPYIELVLGILYLLGFYLVVVNIITLAIMIIGSVGVWLKLKAKEEIPCVCMGAVFKVPMTWVTLVENVLMALMAVVMLVS